LRRLRLDHDLDARQMLRQRAPALATPGTPRALEFRVRLLGFGIALGDRLLNILERQVELIRVQRLRAPAELHPLELAQEVAQAIVLVLDPLPLGPFGDEFRLHRDDRRAERSDIIRERFEVAFHDQIHTTESACCGELSGLATSYCAVFGRPIRGT
jgi:hypothetical protein